MQDAAAPLIDFIAYIRRLEDAEFDMAATLYVFIGIDMLCLVECGKEKQTGKDFIAWVDKYMTADPRQPYQYRGKDVYAARCAALHEYGSQSTAHDKPDIKKFGYTDGGKHSYDPSVDADLVLIGTKSFTDDFIRAVEKFIKTVMVDEVLRKNLAARLPKILMHIPI